MNFRQLLRVDAKTAVVAALRDEREFESFALEVERYARRYPAITECDDASLIDAIAECASFGVPMGEAFIKAKRSFGDRKPEAVAILGYHGKVRLLKHHRLIIDIDAKCVYEKDSIEIVDGTHPQITHRYSPDLLQRGALVGGWCQCLTTRRITKIVVMHRSEIDDIRLEYSDDYATGDLEEFARWFVPKTLIHQMEKHIQIPANVRIPRDRFDRDAAKSVREIPAAATHRIAADEGDVDPFTGMRGEVFA